MREHVLRWVTMTAEDTWTAWQGSRLRTQLPGNAEPSKEGSLHWPGRSGLTAWLPAFPAMRIWEVNQLQINLYPFVFPSLIPDAWIWSYHFPNFSYFNQMSGILTHPKKMKIVQLNCISINSDKIQCRN